jgi:hypothetical protein
MIVQGIDLAAERRAVLVGVQNGAEVYRQVLTVGGSGRKNFRVKFPSFTPTAPGEIAWAITIQDADPGNSSATAITKGRQRHDEGEGEDDERDEREDGDDDHEDESD